MSKKDVEKVSTTVGTATTRVSGDYNKQEEVRTGLTQSSSSFSEQRHSFNRAIEETNENIKRSIEESRKEIPRNTQAFTDYQEQTLQAAKEISESYLDTQKEIISSFQSAWTPHIENYYNMWNNWASPRRTAERYSRAMSNIAENTLTATRIGNNATVANMEAFSAIIQRRKEDAKEFSRIGANIAMTYAQTTSDIAGSSDNNGN
jgi:ABC-type transporter Mla subunit MlaD